ncbi:MAG: response regulator [Azospirillum sp.]|nr:response regulator [Azospirillum sp.]MCA3265081.1 response regulator [Azospirillum sp.]
MAYQFGKIRVMVVEDNPHMRKLLKALLAAIGVGEIVEATDGGVAWMLMKQNPVDFALIDWEMYPVNGLTLVRKIRTEPDSPNHFLPIIMVTGYTERERVMRARDVGVTEFLAKPVSAQTLAQRIEELIERPRPYVRTREYFGPCRRRKKGGIYIGPERRAELGA